MYSQSYNRDHILHLERANMHCWYIVFTGTLVFSRIILVKFKTFLEESSLDGTMTSSLMALGIMAFSVAAQHTNSSMPRVENLTGFIHLA
jgi:hypothetical protein